MKLCTEIVSTDRLTHEEAEIIAVSVRCTRDRIAFEHPAVFPEQLAEDHILSWSDPGDLVLDPMCGSGTTCKMAAIHQRDWIGIDVSEDYINIARQRIPNPDHAAKLSA